MSLAVALPWLAYHLPYLSIMRATELEPRQLLLFIACSPEPQLLLTGPIII
jgi:hypothetical protein